MLLLASGAVPLSRLLDALFRSEVEEPLGLIGWAVLRAGVVRLPRIGLTGSLAFGCLEVSCRRFIRGGILRMPGRSCEPQPNCDERRECYEERFSFHGLIDLDLRT